MSNHAETLEIERGIDRIADRFEAAFRNGQLPKIEGFLPEISEAWQTTLLRELLAVEVQLRQERGETPQREEYERRFPGRRADVGLAFELAEDTEDGDEIICIDDHLALAAIASILRH